MARKDDYAWGKERPSARMGRLRRLADQSEPEIQAARAAYEKTVAGIRARQALLLQECDKIERCLDANGVYVPALAKAVSPGAWNSIENPIKRPRGRPRKNFPGDPLLPRKSRAKAGGRTTRRSSARAPANIPARVPTPAPKAAPQVAAALLESTTAGGLGVDTIQIETPEKAFEIRPVEHRTVQITVVENDPEYEAELAEQAARAKAQWDAENEPGEEIPPEGLPRQKTKFSMNYDFSDAMDQTKVDPAILALFPHFGFATTEPSESMSKEDLRRWLFATRYSDEPNDEARMRRFNDALRIRRDIPGVYNAVRHRLDPLIQRERDRIMVWHTVHLRVINAEQYSASAAKGEMDQDLAFMWMAHRDYIALGNLTDSEHLVWREIVDAMEWPKGFSRIDLALWAEQDPNVVPDVRSWAGEPKNFPERLRFVPFPP
ncbi:hypothetical protein IC232_26865 [Microvirga sp. BT688]|uniref:hypothetical protein n=1 Tax=Microvirga sp. TaxID=1873136 RepID=UPI001689F902|nr:hypothetical protein [Microvirga sp.]MBD2750288.1 hypothetical protein [Microvirga sp.]